MQTDTLNDLSVGMKEKGLATGPTPRGKHKTQHVNLRGDQHDGSASKAKDRFTQLDSLV